MPPAWSIWLITQPPKMSPLMLVSRGMAITRIVSSPRGACSSAELAMVAPSPPLGGRFRVGLRRSSRHDTIETGEVPDSPGVDKAACLCDREHARCLAGADFDHQPAAPVKQRPRLR